MTNDSLTFIVLLCVSPAPKFPLIRKILPMTIAWLKQSIVVSNKSTCTLSNIKKVNKRNNINILIKNERLYSESAKLTNRLENKIPLMININDDLFETPRTYKKLQLLDQNLSTKEYTLKTNILGPGVMVSIKQVTITIPTNMNAKDKQHQRHY